MCKQAYDGEYRVDQPAQLNNFVSRSALRARACVVGCTHAIPHRLFITYMLDMRINLTTPISCLSTHMRSSTKPCLRSGLNHAASDAGPAPKSTPNTASSLCGRKLAT